MAHASRYQSQGRGVNPFVSRCDHMCHMWCLLLSIVLSILRADASLTRRCCVCARDVSRAIECRRLLTDGPRTSDNRRVWPQQ